LLSGLTFRSGQGELRVLPRAEVPHPAGDDIRVLALGSGPRIASPASRDWEALLRLARPWP
jgi:hypothetical protein